MFVLDTNTLIYFSRGEPAVKNFLLSSLSHNQILAISIITLVEFLSYPKINHQDESFFHSYALQFLKVEDLDYGLALQAVAIKRTYGLNLADSIIAALARANNAILISRDKDFKKIKEIEVIVL